MIVEPEHIRNIGKILSNKERPLKERFRALFTLKNIGGEVSLECINEAFADESALLKHELAYCLGQMQDAKAIPYLVKVLEDTSQEPMVRHEAGEALGAIGSPEVKEILEKYIADPVIEVAETCQIALDRIKWLESDENNKDLAKNIYSSVDPSPCDAEKDVETLKKVLMDESESLFNRYRAMFSLRNLRTEESILALGEGLKAKSALFRHEIAFVLGQLQSPLSIQHLKSSLEDPVENEMVRHECAEALGAIANDECMEILNKFASDEKRVVKESCEIALDMCEYENSPEFQYADGLKRVTVDEAVAKEEDGSGEGKVEEEKKDEEKILKDVENLKIDAQT